MTSSAEESKSPHPVTIPESDRFRCLHTWISSSSSSSSSDIIIFTHIFFLTTAWLLSSFLLLILLLLLASAFDVLFVIDGSIHSARRALDDEREKTHTPFYISIYDTTPMYILCILLHLPSKSPNRCDL